METNMLITITDPDPMRIFKKMNRNGYPKDWKVMVDRDRILVMIAYYRKTVWIKKRFHTLFKTWEDEVPETRSNLDSCLKEAEEKLIPCFFPGTQFKVEYNVG